MSGRQTAGHRRDVLAVDRAQLTSALFISWFVYSVIIFLVLLTPFVLSGKTIERITPKCAWRVRYHKPCPACGLTTGFRLISAGQFRRAEALNRYSLPLYTLFLLNEIILLGVLGGKIAHRYARRPQCQQS